MGAAKPFGIVTATKTAMQRVVLWAMLSTMLAFPADTFGYVANTVKVVGETMVNAHHLVAVLLLTVAVTMMILKIFDDVLLLMRLAFAVIVTCVTMAQKLVTQVFKWLLTEKPVTPAPAVQLPSPAAYIKTEAPVAQQPAAAAYIKTEPLPVNDKLQEAVRVFNQAWNVNAMYQIKRDSYWAAEGTKKMKTVLIMNGVPDTETQLLNHVCWTIHSLNGHVNSTYKKTLFASMPHEEQRAVAVKLIHDVLARKVAAK